MKEEDKNVVEEPVDVYNELYTYADLCNLIFVSSVILRRLTMQANFTASNSLTVLVSIIQ